MSIAGLWHGGDSWNFLLWGIAHGAALSVDRLWNQAKLGQVPVLLSRVLTLLFVFLAWTIFRAHTFENGLQMYAGQFGLHGFGLSDAMSVILRPSHWLAYALGIACVMVPLLQGWTERQTGPAVVLVATVWPIVGFLFSFALIASRGAVPFLYFQF